MNAGENGKVHKRLGFKADQSLTNMTQMRKRVLKTKMISIGTCKTAKVSKCEHFLRKPPASPTHPSACPQQKGKQVACPNPASLRSQKCHCGRAPLDLLAVLQHNTVGYCSSLLVNWQIGLEL